MYSSYIKFTLVVLVYLTACVSPHVVHQVPSEPKPSESQTRNENSHLQDQSWDFKAQKEFNAYTSRTQSIIQMNLDSSVTTDTVLTTVHFLLGLNRLESVDTISGYIDHAGFISGRSIKTEQKPLTVPVVFSGSATLGRILLDPLHIQADIGFCENQETAHLNELHPALFFLPQHLQVGARWSDTVSTIKCTGAKLPLQIEIIRSYLVHGDTQIDGLHQILITRTEITNVSGNGSQGQHRMIFKGEGSGVSKIFLSPETGTTRLVEATQQLLLILYTSGKRYRFTQHVQQRIELTSVN